VEKGVEGYLSDTEVIISIFYICGLLDMVNTMKDPFKMNLDSKYQILESMEEDKGFSNVVDSTIDNIYLKFKDLTGSVTRKGNLAALRLTAMVMKLIFCMVLLFFFFAFTHVILVFILKYIVWVSVK
jgi:hypothetical protein